MHPLHGSGLGADRGQRLLRTGGSDSAGHHPGVALTENGTAQVCRGVMGGAPHTMFERKDVSRNACLQPFKDALLLDQLIGMFWKLAICDVTKGSQRLVGICGVFFFTSLAQAGGLRLKISLWQTPTHEGNAK